MIGFVPYYAIGNLCIACKSSIPSLQQIPLEICRIRSDLHPAWMLFWNSSNLKTAHIFVTINSLTQLFYITTQLDPMSTSSASSILTHIVSKTFAGIGVLDLLHNGSVAFYKDAPASLAVRVLTGLGFGLASASSDWIFGGCLVYDLVALAVGQTGSWRTLLGAYAVGSAAIVAATNLAR